MDAVSIVNRIYQVARLIYDQAKQAQANQAQCQRLADRVCNGSNQNNFGS